MPSFTFLSSYEIYLSYLFPIFLINLDLLNNLDNPFIIFQTKILNLSKKESSTSFMESIAYLPTLLL